MTHYAPAGLITSDAEKTRAILQKRLASLIETRSAGEDYTLGRAPVMAHLAALDKVYEQVGADHRKSIADVSGLDPVTEDLLIFATAQLEKNHWFVKAHLSDAEGRVGIGDPA